MITSEVEIYNMALRHLAVSQQVVATSDKTKEAKACLAFYPTVRDEVLRDFAWPFAKKTVTLALVTDNTGVANAEWAYAYRYPSDCIAFRRIHSGFRNESREQQVPYLLSQDDTGKLINTDMINAIGDYTVQITDVTRFDPDFVQACALLLACYIGPSVAGGDKFKLADRALQMYNWKISWARANALNEQKYEIDPRSELERARD